MTDPPTYDDALEWLFARTRAGDARSAERSRALLEVVGRPDRAFPSVHVIGTNGKGSVCAMLERGLRVAHERVGRFTSPHLLDFRERIVVNDAMIPKNAVLMFVRWAREHAHGAAFFDLTFVMAMQHFERAGVEVAVVEAGVGGTGDASNALEHVALTVLTNVDLDHEAVIGVGPEDSVLKNIALEKAGAIRASAPVVTAARGDALEVIRRVARERSATVYELEDSALFALPGMPRLRGAHQLENARLAAAALRLLGYCDDAVRASLEATWPGRLEVFTRGERRVILDGAHNPAGAHALASSLRGERFALVFGAMSRKNVHAILEPLRALADDLHFVSPGALGTDPRTLSSEYGGMAYDSLEAALDAALEGQSDVLVAGSLYLVGAARALLEARAFSVAAVD